MTRRVRGSRGSLVVGVLVSALLLAACDWNTYRGNAGHTGNSNGEQIIGVDNVGELEERWTTPGGDPSLAYNGGTPIVAEGRLYMNMEWGYLGAFDAAGVEGCGGTPRQCQPVWRAENGAGNGTTVADGVVYATTEVEGGVEVDPVLRAYDASGTRSCSGTPPTCTPMWSATLGPAHGTGAISPATVVGGVVYLTAVTGVANVLYAFDAAGRQGCDGGVPATCSPLWTAPFGDPTFAGYDVAGRAPAVSAGKVYVTGKFDFRVHVFDAAGQEGCSGSPKVCSELWAAAVPPFTCAASFCEISGPAVAKGVLYVTGDARDGTGGLYAFDATGRSCGGTPRVCEPLWRAVAGPTITPPAIANGVVYTVDYELDLAFGLARLRAFDASGGQGCAGAPKVCEPLWTSTTSGLTSAPMVANGVVYASSFSDVDYCEYGWGCSGIAHILAFDGAGIQGCSGMPKQCAPLLDAARPRGTTFFENLMIANGVLYAGEFETGGGVARVRAFTP